MLTSKVAVKTNNDSLGGQLGTRSDPFGWQCLGHVLEWKIAPTYTDKGVMPLLSASPRATISRSLG